MSYITLRTTVESVEVTAAGYNSIDLEVAGLDSDDVLKEIGAQSAIEFFGEDELLEAMDEDLIRKYLGIEEEKQ